VKFPPVAEIILPPETGLIEISLRIYPQRGNCAQHTMEYFQQHAMDFYGCDWAAMGFTFLSLYLLGNRSRTGFLIGIIANFFWFSYGYQTDSIANMFCSFVVICLQARGWNNWKPKPATDTPETAVAD
jgi:hypothetical protein